MKVSKKTEPPIPVIVKTIITIELELLEAEKLKAYLSHTSLHHVKEFLNLPKLTAKPINEILWQIYSRLDDLGVSHARN